MEIVHLMDDPQREPCSATRGGNRIKEARAQGTGKHDVRLRRQIRKTHARTRGQAMRSRKCNHNRFMQHSFEDQIRAIDRWGDEADMQALFLNRLHLLCGTHIANEDTDIRMSFRKCSHDFDEVISVRWPSDTNQQLSGLALPDPLTNILRMLCLREHHTRFLDEHLAGGCELDVVFGPIEEPDTELVLKELDLLAERRLADVQSVGSLTKVEGFGDGDDVSKVAEFHDGSRARLSNGDIQNVSRRLNNIFPPIRQR